MGMLRRLLVGRTRAVNFGDVPVPQHEETKYVNATVLCQCRGKRYADWRRLDAATNIIHSVHKITGLSEEELIVTTPATATTTKTTWMDYRLAAALAAWVDPVFIIYTAQLAMTNFERTEPPEPSPWLEQLSHAERLVRLMKDVGGLDQRDELFYRDSIRNISKHLIGPGQPPALITDSENGPPHELSLSELCTELAIPPERNLLIKAGRLAAKRYREVHNEDPPKRRQWVDGVEREINHYTSADRPWLSEILRAMSER
jgi:hypothetical protein